MCQIVYLTSRLFDTPSGKFKKALARELKGRNIKVVTDSAYRLKKILQRSDTYGIAIAIDFFRDGNEGSGLTLSQRCAFISRDFAYSISNAIDDAMPRTRWRDFQFVDSDKDKTWKLFFDKIHSETKAIFYLCTYNNSFEYNNFMIRFDEIVKSFADEIVRCLRSNYNVRDYQKRVKIARLKTSRL